MKKLTQHFPLTALATILCLAYTAHADVTSGASSAFGVQSSESAAVDGTSDTLTPLSGTATLNVGPIPAVSGDAPFVYNESASLVAGDADATSSGDLDLLGSAVEIGLSTGVLEVFANSDVDGGSGPRTANADATVNHLSNSAFMSLAVSSTSTTFFDLGATEVNSSAGVNGDYGSLVTVGSTILADATFSILGAGGGLLGIDLNAEVGSEPAPNTEFLFTSSGATLNGSAFGLGATSLIDGQIRLLLNEQIESGDGVSFSSIVVNAMRLSFENAVFGAADIDGFSDGEMTINGELIVSHSQAELIAIPELSSAVSMLLAIAAVGFTGFHRRRRRQR